MEDQPNTEIPRQVSSIQLATDRELIPQQTPASVSDSMPTDALGRIIRGEVFMTSGPRKERDSELGEDCGAVILTMAKAMLLVADGTSEGSQLRLPRSEVCLCNRFLAQTITACVRRRLSAGAYKSPVPMKLGEILEQAWQDTATEWNKYLACPPDDMITCPTHWSQTIPREIDFVDFSTTLLIACLHPSGQASVASVGDSPYVVKRLAQRIEAFRPENPGRLFLRLRLRPSFEGFSALTRFPVWSQEFEQVEFLLAGSDGIGTLPELMASITCPESAVALIPWILKFRPGTFDDKTLCLLSLEDRC